MHAPYGTMESVHIILKTELNLLFIIVLAQVWFPVRVSQVKWQQESCADLFCWQSCCYAGGAPESQCILGNF